MSSQGRAYALRIEYRETTGCGRFRLVWDHGVDKGWQARIDEAVRGRPEERRRGRCRRDH